VNTDLLELIWQASLIVKLVLLVLVVMSVMSWGIIVAKWRELRGAEQDNDAFIEVYHGEPFETVFDAGRQLDRGPLAIIFLTSCNTLGDLARNAGQQGLGPLSAKQQREIGKTIEWTAARERTRLERGLTFLATVGSSAPFIGLFGTVVGIISTFQGIGMAGNASLAVVGRGMAEALIATGVGLLAAIPASMAFNAFLARIDAITGAVDLFAAEFREDLAHLEPKQPRPAMHAVDG
jgi:biopolymer transport protein TolQ